MSEQRYSAEVEANLRELAALGDREIDVSDIPEITDFAGFRDRQGEWMQSDRRFVMDVGEELASWFGDQAVSGEDWREVAKRVLQEFKVNAPTNGGLSANHDGGTRTVAAGSTRNGVITQDRAKYPDAAVPVAHVRNVGSGPDKFRKA